MPKKKVAEKQPAVAMEGVSAAAAPAAAKAPAKAVKKARAPRASSKAVTHKHKKTTPAPAPVEPVAAEVSSFVPVEPVAVPVPAEPSYEEVARLAFSYWEARGYQGGSQEEDWFRALNELRNRR